jgi:MauM/NapG family ferredoxin protein
MARQANVPQTVGKRAGKQWVWVRQVVQLALLLLFLYLVWSTTKKGVESLPINLFSRFDPLIALMSMVGSKSFIPNVIPGLITIVATLILGRFWCGWICPLGTVLDLYGPHKRPGLSDKLRRIKYFLLAAFVAAALLGVLALMWLDPITILVRPLAGAIFPAYLQRHAPIQPLAGLPSVRVAQLPLKPVVYPILAVPLLIVLGLNLVARRFWCRYLCPLGALVALLSKFAWIKRRVNEPGCIQSTPDAFLPPCKGACPIGTDPEKYISLIAEGKFAEALKVARETNPFVSVCGRVCYHPCEEECNRGKAGEPLSIAALKRFLADYALQHGDQAVQKAQVTRKEKVAVIGSGPAGLTAALDLTNLGYAVTVYEALPESGGMLRYGIPPYRLPKDILAQEIGRIAERGVRILTNSPVKDAKGLLSEGYNAALVAVGAQKDTMMGLGGEDLQGVYSALDFLRRIDQGEKVEVGKRVFVVGGGNTAIDAARSCLRLGSDVTILYRRSRAEMPAHEFEVAAAEAEGLKIQFLVNPTRITGRDGRVSGVECVRMKLGAPDETGRRKPTPIEGSEFVLEADAVIEAIGQAAELSPLPAEVQLTRSRTIAVDAETLATNVKGIFAAGDAVTGPRNVVEAIAAGHRAAEGIHKYLSGEEVELLPRIGQRRIVELNEGEVRERLAHQGKTVSERAKMPTLPVDTALQGFEEAELGLSEEDAIAEAKRCVQCTLQCGFCVWKCPTNTIEEIGLRSDPGECLQCLNCLVRCPVGATGFKGTRTPGFGYDYDPSRRQLLASLVVGIGGAALLKWGGLKSKYAYQIRPPGATEEEFLSKCIRCGQCIKVCPNNALHLMTTQGGIESVFTPVLVPRIGNCSWECNACGQTCPTQAIPRLSLEEKRKQKMGTAVLNTDTCIRCLICTGECPVEGALVEGTIEGLKGKYPIVNADLCIGCGACEFVCPVQGEAAIRVHAPES